MINWKTLEIFSILHNKAENVPAALVLLGITAFFDASGKISEKTVIFGYNDRPFANAESFSTGCERNISSKNCSLL